MTRKQLRQFNKIISITEELFKKQDEGIRNFLIERPFIWKQTANSKIIPNDVLREENEIEISEIFNELMMAIEDYKWDDVILPLDK